MMGTVPWWRASGATHFCRTVYSEVHVRKHKACIPLLEDRTAIFESLLFVESANAQAEYFKNVQHHRDTHVSHAHGETCDSHLSPLC